MENSFRIVPAPVSKTASIQDTANSLGLHDTLQYGPRKLAAELKSENGLKDRLEQWEATQDNLRLTIDRQVYGLHMPMRRLMERKLVTDQTAKFFTPRNNLHLDVLMGRDETIDFADVFMGFDSEQTVDMHQQFLSRKQVS